MYSVADVLDFEDMAIYSFTLSGDAAARDRERNKREKPESLPKQRRHFCVSEEKTNGIRSYIEGDTTKKRRRRRYRRHHLPYPFRVTMMRYYFNF